MPLLEYKDSHHQINFIKRKWGPGYSGKTHADKSLFPVTLTNEKQAEITKKKK